MRYITELHAHSSELSGCAEQTVLEVAEDYIKCGYDSLVISNHFSKGRMNGCESYESYVDRFFDAVDFARREFAGRIFIIDGMELNLEGSSNEYLIFGVTREIMHSLPCLFERSIEEVHELFGSVGCLVIQAHPMRWRMTVVKPEWVDGYEVLNTHSEWDSHNAVVRHLAESIAPRHIFTSGTDHHAHSNKPSSGIITRERIETSAQLAQVLRSGDFYIFGKEQRKE